MTTTLAGSFVALVLILTPQFAFGAIEGSEGNEKVNDARMPKGAAAIINRRDRIACWEGDGGPFHADGRGGAKAVRKIVTDFAKLDVKTKRLVIHDGIGQSYWLDRDKQSDIKKDAQIDWTFSVWPKGKWENSRRMFPRPSLPPPEKPDLPAQIDVYTANIRWAEVVVPAGIEVIDERLEAHGFTAADGIVIEGHVKELQSGLPMVATVRVQRLESKKGEGQVYADIAESKSNEDGVWALKNLSAGQIRIVVEADGFVPRVAGHVRCYDQPQWHSFESGLARTVSISGRVTDQSGTPLADVDVRLDDVMTEPSGEYDSPTEYKFKTDAEGHFRFDQAPAGKSTVRLRKSGYSMDGLGQPVTLQANEIELQLLKAGSIRVTVDFNGQKRPNKYIVEFESEGGNAVGKYTGFATIDDNNVFTFENVPPGKYIVKGRPNRYRETGISEAITIELQSDEAAQVTIKAK